MARGVWRVAARPATRSSLKGCRPLSSLSPIVAAVSKWVILRDLWRRGQHGWPEDFPLAQLPNAPLLTAGGGWLVAAVTGGLVHDGARATFYVGLAVWAWKELEEGVNWVRKGIGAAGLLFAVARIAEALRS